MNKVNLASLFLSLLLVLGLSLALVPTTAQAANIPTDTYYGTWDGTTYTLTTDVTEEIVIDDDNFTLDGQSKYTVSAPVLGKGTGVYLDGKTGVTIKNLIVKNFDSGIYLHHSNNNTLEANTVSGNGYGIDLIYSNNNTLEANTASNNDAGIQVESSDGNELIDNTASSNSSCGIHLCYCDNNSLEGNTAEDNSEYGIYLDYSDNNSLEGNTAEDNSEYGILLVDSSSNTVESNTVSSNYTGIYLDFSTDNTLKGNTAEDNSEYGIIVESSGSNTIYNNYFNNSANFYSLTPILGNAWNTTKALGTNIVGGPYLGGNFWARPDGTGFSQTTADRDGDGICDEGYTLAIGNVDNLPLALPQVVSVTLDPLSPVGAGSVTFTIVFSQNMDTSVFPTVTFGKDDPYNEHTIDKTSYSADKWVGTFTIGTGYDGEQRISISGAKNPAGITMLADTSHTFVVDTNKPTVSITDPSENQTVSSASYTIEGTADDNGGSGIARVEVTINDGSTWNDAKDTNPWSYGATLVAGDNVVKARSIDKAGNVSNETPEITLTYKTDKPTVKSLTLNPASPVTVGEVTFTIVFSEDMDTSTSPTVTFGTALPYTDRTVTQTSYSADTWKGKFTITTGYDGEQHISISGAQDLADNIMDTDSSHTFLVDTTSPAGSISINGDAGYTNSRSVTLTFNASSSSASLSLANASASLMRFKNEDSSWSSWESYSSSRSWTLSSGDGKKTVSVEFKDSAGNVSKTYSGSIILHRTPPTVAITSPCAESCLRGEVTVEGTATDDYFEKYEIEFAEGVDPSSWHEITSCCFAVVEAELCCWNVSSLSDGTYTLKLTAWDLASNFAEVKVVLKVDNHPPQTTLTEYPSEKVTGNTPQAVAAFSWIGSDPDNITPVEKLVYQYRLEGHSSYQDWSEWSKNSSSTFLLPSGSYSFKVRAKDEAGNYPSEDDSETARYSFTVSLPLIIYPNPCYLNQAGFLTFSNLPLESEVRIYIYDVAGNLVRSLKETDAVIEGGSKVATWDLRNNKGEMLARGIYIYYILNATEKRSGKIAIIN